MNRREFVKGSACAGLSLAVPSILQAANKGQKVRMGFIGVGNRGTLLLHTFMKHADVEVTALCDVYEPYLNRDAAAFDPNFRKFAMNLPRFTELDKRLAHVKRYTDYRKLLEDPNVDAVCIATPDHWHAIQTIEAIQAGKDVYVEKPLTGTIVEGRAMVNAQKNSDRVVAVGLNRRASDAYHELKKQIDTGRFGTFRVGRAARYSNLFPHGIGMCPDCPPPKGLDWDAWIGPRPYRPYRYTTAPYFFRWHQDFSSQMGNWGVHYIDVMRWMMGEEAPTAVTAIGGQYYLDHDADIPDTMEVIFEFADKRMINFSIFEGGSAGIPSSAGVSGEIELQGSDGLVYASEDGFTILPHDRPREFNNPKSPTFEKSVYVAKNEIAADGSSAGSTDRIVRNFIDCVKSRGTPCCTLETGHRSTSFAHLGNIALKVGGRLEWDAKAERFTNSEKANKLLHYAYRDGYKLG